MTPDDAPTKPLPAVGVQNEAAAAPTEPLIAPHVPVANVATAEVASMAPAPVSGQGRWAKRVLIVGLTAAATAVIAVLALSGLQRGGIPVPGDSSAPPAAPSPSTPEENADVVTDPEPPPPPAEPSPEPTPSVEPTVEPTPLPTP